MEMVNLYYFVNCPTCNQNVMQLYPTGNLKIGRRIIKEICIECFENILGDNLVEDCTACGSDSTLLKRYNRTNGTFTDVIHCSDCDFEFTTEELDELKEYHEKVNEALVQPRKSKRNEKKVRTFPSL